MDVTRSAIRLGAKTVTVVYRRRQVDMTALPEEVRSAVAEGAQIMELHAPVRIDTDSDDKVTALVAQPKLIGLIGKDGRPKPSRSEKQEVSIPCDVVIVAIGQGLKPIILKSGRCDQARCHCCRAGVQLRTLRVYLREATV